MLQDHFELIIFAPNKSLSYIAFEVIGIAEDFHENPSRLIWPVFNFGEVHVDDFLLVLFHVAYLLSCKFDHFEEHQILPDIKNS